MTATVIFLYIPLFPYQLKRWTKLLLFGSLFVLIFGSTQCALHVPKAPPRVSLFHVCQKRPKGVPLGYESSERLREHVPHGHASPLSVKL